MTDPKSHNLNIHLYKFEELLELFGLSDQISSDDIKRAKKKVLMTHPDKSKLPAKYFLFYKKAYDLINTFYETQNKQNITVPNEKIEYEPTSHNDLNQSSNSKISSIVNDMSSKDFQSNFNRLFDENMKTTPDTTKNQWFSDHDAIYHMDEHTNSSNMGQNLDKFKETQAKLVKYNGVTNLFMNSGSGTSLYEDNEDDYVSCDPFSKLKYDDLRKVHKDQTVFSVSERDIEKVTRYSSTDHLMRERGKQQLTPLLKSESEKILSMQNSQYRTQIMQKEYADKLKTTKYEDKNKTILATFLRLT
jgi:hypothetical protein